MHDQKDEMMRQLLELQEERDTLLITSKQEKDFQETIADLESQLLEKNKVKFTVKFKLFSQEKSGSSHFL